MRKIVSLLLLIMLFSSNNVYATDLSVQKLYYENSEDSSSIELWNKAKFGEVAFSLYKDDCLIKKDVAIDENGRAYFGEIAEGKYKIVETKHSNICKINSKDVIVDTTGREKLVIYPKNEFGTKIIENIIKKENNNENKENYEKLKENNLLTSTGIFAKNGIMGIILLLLILIIIKIKKTILK
ncbi:prealbumin-like fold domain-containing protein [Gemelliphila asaccharolytica]|uniref:SpaA-like prealbumin fold domain-containing protein n=1 Tax=Gemelliphila asaccharolytica TaxID=502393 RepID=A0ABR5TP90_9BACL|nr:prealbumin-like fold domain-containing protein [Gemella asaccharolytica]KXB57671.1 hypothetical protein HMPREF1871_00843 [Gemella asaccharolytica]